MSIVPCDVSHVFKVVRKSHAEDPMQEHDVGYIVDVRGGMPAGLGVN